MNLNDAAKLTARLTRDLNELDAKRLALRNEATAALAAIDAEAAEVERTANDPEAAILDRAAASAAAPLFARRRLDTVAKWTEADAAQYRLQLRAVAKLRQEAEPLVRYILGQSGVSMMNNPRMNVQASAAQMAVAAVNEQRRGRDTLPPHDLADGVLTVVQRLRLAALWPDGQAGTSPEDSLAARLHQRRTLLSRFTCAARGEGLAALDALAAVLR